MNKEELINKFWEITGYEKAINRDIFIEEKEISQFIKVVQQDFLKEVLPEERTEGILGILGSVHKDGVINQGFNECRQEIINRAKEKGIEI